MTADRPRFAEDFSPDKTERVQRVLLSIVEALGDLASQICIVGGMVPTLLVELTSDDEQHVGTTELDVVFSRSILEGDHYAEIARRLSQLGLKPATKADTGELRHQTWELAELGITVDFLIEPDSAEVQGGTIKHLDDAFAAFNIPGAQLSFDDPVLVDLDGTNIDGHRVLRQVQVCSVPVFVILKALAIRGRNEPKDCYDLVFVLKRNTTRLNLIADSIRELALRDDGGHVSRALTQLQRDFASVDHVGPQRYAQFLNHGRPDDDLSQDAYGLVSRLCALWSPPSD